MNQKNIQSTNSIIIPLGTAVLFAIFIVAGGLTLRYRMRQSFVDLMSIDILKLARIFERINKTCVILEFDYQKNPINFLNVKSFIGSEVGPMNLAYPDRWEGPYLSKNPTIQSIEYQIVRTRKGYFITPGQGVMLPNRKVIGKDIIFDERSDIQAMLKDAQFLNIRGRSLAMQIHIGKSLFDLP